jgi:tetratricopeptide (TPR) repeat protein
MNSETLQRSASAESGKHAEALRVELAAVQAHLDAPATDLACLLAHILEQPLARQQIQGLLEQSYSRLQELRAAHGELAERLAAAGLDEPCARAAAALSGGADLSLARVDQACEQAYRECLERGLPADLAARLRAQQALAAAAMLDFRHAAALYAEAAATAGIDPARHTQYLNRQAAVLEDLGREFLDIEALQAAVDLYENAILPRVSRQQQPELWAQTQNRLGNALGILGQRHRGTRMLELAIAAFERALEQFDRERNPADWAAAQNNLGNALGILGQRHKDLEMLDAAVTAFAQALEVRSQESLPGEWATTQNNLAAVLLSLGQQRKDAKLLKRAVESYRAVLGVWVRERMPFTWATTMNNLGTALRMLGEQRKGPRTLEQAVAAYNAALSVRTRERVPQDWAMTQNNLGAALQVLGERTEDALLLGRAIAAYAETIKEWTRESRPMSWAMTMANLGVARRKYAEAGADIDIARRATVDLKMAVDVFRGASHAELTQLGEEQLAIARKLADALAAAAPD